MDSGGILGPSQGEMWMVILPRVIRVDLRKRSVERDHRFGIGGLEEYGVFKPPVPFEGHHKRGVLGANRPQRFGCLIRLFGGHKWEEDSEMRRHFCE